VAVNINSRMGNNAVEKSMARDRGCTALRVGQQRSKKPKKANGKEIDNIAPNVEKETTSARKTITTTGSTIMT
jgi:hypothetical protein